jgi:hypothetical protein
MARPEYHSKEDRNRLFNNTLIDPENGVRDHSNTCVALWHPYSTD